MAVDFRVISPAGNLAGVPFPPILLARLDSGFTAPPLFSPTLIHHFTGLEKILLNVESEPRLQDLLGRGAEIDPTFPAMMLRLVRLGSVNPNPAGRVHVDRPHVANLPGSHAGEALELDHRPDLAGDMRPDDIDERVGDRPDRLRLPDVGPAPAEAGDSLETVMDGGGNQLLTHSPFERPDDLARSLVHFIPTEAGVDHRLANRLETDRPEFPGYGIAIESTERPEG
jgi:hypothetical protein